ncbi:serine hydrolase domain-containing protein [Niabella beijingensis]|uniref:serine hydrolase domain-containing protein n=1 Tax=Niabella beijingensis TaxID=2872700 RepID=UPI001CBE74DE|nr:serine hydrolase domain-containing protein [Niabella beijingensis]MBZ4192439.1 beta-lactamase family protein [Niabella beijingensis]
MEKASLWLQTCFLICLIAGVRSTGIAQVKNWKDKPISEATIDEFLKKQMDSLHIPALSIALINDGKLVYHRAWGLADLDTHSAVNDSSLFEAASISKPLFAFFVMKMVEKGLLNLDKPLYQYLPFPELSHDNRYKQVTARMVLSHTTGFPNWRWLDPATGDWSSRHKMYMQCNPGTFSYSGEAYNYLARVVAHINGLTLKNLDSLFQREVAGPLSMKYAFFSWNPLMGQNKVTGYQGNKVYRHKWNAADAMYDDSTVFGPANALHTEAVSYARFVTAMINGYGLQPESINEMLKMQSRIPPEQEDHFGVIKGWGLGFAIEPTGQGVRYSHTGENPGFLAFCAFSREQKNGYVFFTNGDQGGILNIRLRIFLEG